MNKKTQHELENRVNKAVDHAVQNMGAFVDAIVKEHLKTMVVYALGFEKDSWNGVRMASGNKNDNSPLMRLVSSTVERRIGEYWRPAIEAELVKFEKNKTLEKFRASFTTEFNRIYTQRVEYLLSGQARESAEKMAEEHVAELVKTQIFKVTEPEETDAAVDVAQSA